MNDSLIEFLASVTEKKVQNRESGTYDTRQFNKEFARAIIDICIDLVEDGVDHREPASTYADKIREHFGIERVEDGTE
jgi:hypothetical protein